MDPMGDVVWQASSVTGIARVYQDMGQRGFALKYWEQAFHLFERAGLKSINGHAHLSRHGISGDR